MEVLRINSRTATSVQMKNETIYKWIREIKSKKKKKIIIIFVVFVFSPLEGNLTGEKR